MAFILALLFLALGVIALVAYNGTPHVGPTALCGPIHLFNHTFTVSVDCRYITSGELVLTAVFFLLAILIVLSARPGSTPPQQRGPR